MKAIRFAGYLTMTMVLGGTLSGIPAQGQGMPEHAHVQAVLSTSLTLVIEGKATTLSVAELQAMPQKTVTVHNPHTKMDENYTGVELSDLLAKYGAALDKTTQRRILRSYLRVEGTDHYFVLYSAAEIEGEIHNVDVIVATGMNGSGVGEDGAIKLVASGDKKPMRWVRNATKISLVTVD
ncbi:MULTISPECIES: molybdopterin-dependent oxidoreductase [Acidobacteriaceae]|uniref:molybdopterin-dependent oxidoreductase n=1 Tax=Acidobacteriaceae TaxID=204434 RepID=UPI00131DE5F0|nr:MULTISPECIES: molybdopterin-dependent oxidoreductase [Acidobacteriaceae]MDW5266450.1 molybdopterin-dependent oxidoreductase [Edaphobacter sp.]